MTTRRTKEIRCGPLIEYYLQDDRRLGSGFRAVIPYGRTEKWISLFDIARLVSTRVRTADYDTARRRSVDTSLIVVGRNLAARAAVLHQHSVRFEPAIVRGILRSISNEPDKEGAAAPRKPTQQGVE